jgi:antibiotic biosynthesis monooxygenase (ABM) superfamily enzyme
MAFMLKIRWDIADGREADFKANQVELSKVMLEHPGVICYHADYPAPA